MSVIDSLELEIIREESKKYKEIKEKLNCPPEAREKAFLYGFYDKDKNYYNCEHYVPYLQEMHTRHDKAGRCKKFKLSEYRVTWFLKEDIDRIEHLARMAKIIKEAADKLIDTLGKFVESFNGATVVRDLVYNKFYILFPSGYREEIPFSKVEETQSLLKQINDGRAEIGFDIGSLPDYQS